MYTGADRDIADMWTTIGPPLRPGRPAVPFSRFLLGWKLINFDRRVQPADLERSEDWRPWRRYLINLGLREACHAEDAVGRHGARSDKFLAGSEVLPGPYPAPNTLRHDVTESTVDERGHGAHCKRSVRPDGLPI